MSVPNTNILYPCGSRSMCTIYTFHKRHEINSSSDKFWGDKIAENLTCCRKLPLLFYFYCVCLQVERRRRKRRNYIKNQQFRFKMVEVSETSSSYLVGKKSKATKFSDWNFKPFFVHCFYWQVRLKFQPTKNQTDDWFTDKVCENIFNIVKNKIREYKPIK